MLESLFLLERDSNTSCFSEIVKRTYFEEHLRTAASLIQIVRGENYTPLKKDHTKYRNFAKCYETLVRIHEMCLLNLKIITRVGYQRRILGPVKHL